MQASETIKQENDNERPLFVKSLNYRRSSNMDPANFDEPPTDRQIKYLRNLGHIGEIPLTRKQASDLIGKLLGTGVNEDIKCQSCGNLTKIKSSINGKFCFKPDCRKASNEAL